MHQYLPLRTATGAHAINPEIGMPEIPIILFVDVIIGDFL
jgi:hypothetical protein